MKLIDTLIESMMDGDAFKSFTSAIITNAPSNVKEIEIIETNQNDVCSLMSITNQQIDPNEKNVNIGNDDINEIIKYILKKLKSEKFDPDIVNKIKKQLNDLKTEMEKLSSDNDVINTNLRQIQNLICK